MNLTFAATLWAVKARLSPFGPRRNPLLTNAHNELMVQRVSNGITEFDSEYRGETLTSSSID